MSIEPKSIHVEFLVVALRRADIDCPERALCWNRTRGKIMVGVRPINSRFIPIISLFSGLSTAICWICFDDFRHFRINPKNILAGARIALKGFCHSKQQRSAHFYGRKNQVLITPRRRKISTNLNRRSLRRSCFRSDRTEPWDHVP